MQPEALRLTYIWIVHSDLDENNLYSEFGSEAQALAYARRHADDLTWVEKVEVAVDEFDEIVEYHDGKTIWVYDDESKNRRNRPTRPQLEELDDDDEETVECQDCGTIVNKSDCLKTDGGTYVCKHCREDFNSLVETLEENEDIVECKECFELFPKADCIKVAVGYVCPTCHQHCEGPDCSEFEIDAIPDVVIADEDIFKLDFPELERIECGNDMLPDESTPEIENGLLSDPEPIAEPCVGPECEAPVEAPVTKDETLTKLVIDEHEAIDGYEKAKIEIEANLELDKEEKEEILDTIEHIKEEEIEHIEELEELIDEVDETKEADEPAEESEPEVEDTEEPEVLAESQAQEISELYRSLSKKYNIDLEDLVYGEDGFMKTKYPEGFPDFAGDVIYSEKYWNEFEAWLKETRGIELTESLTEHVNEEHPAIESDQELEGTDNAVVDCKVNKVITHSEDEKPVDCKGEKKPLEKPLTEDTHAKYAKPEGDYIAAYNNALKYAKKDNVPYIYGYTQIGNGKFFALEQPIKVTGPATNAAKDFRSKYKRASVVCVAYPDKEFVTEGLFTKQEQEEYNMDEDGNSLDSYDTYVRCGFCDEIYTKSECKYERNLGWLCPRCEAAIYSRGEKLTFVDPDEFLIEETRTTSPIQKLDNGVFESGEAAMYIAREITSDLVIEPQDADKLWAWGVKEELIDKESLILADLIKDALISGNYHKEAADYGWDELPVQWSTKISANEQAQMDGYIKACNTKEDKLHLLFNAINFLHLNYSDGWYEDLIGYITMAIGDGGNSIYYVGYDEDEARETVDDLYPDWDDLGLGGGDTDPMVVTYCGSDWNNFNDLVKRFKNGENLSGSDLAVLGYTYYRDLVNYNLRNFDLLD